MPRLSSSASPSDFWSCCNLRQEKKKMLLVKLKWWFSFEVSFGHWELSRYFLPLTWNPVCLSFHFHQLCFCHCKLSPYFLPLTWNPVCLFQPPFPPDVLLSLRVELLLPPSRDSRRRTRKRSLSKRCAQSQDRCPSPTLRSRCLGIWESRELCTCPL